MNPTRFLRSVCSILCLCLLGLSACGTSSTPPTGNTPGASSCGTAGKTHTIQTAMSTPAAQGDWPMFHGDLNRDGAATTGGGSMLTLTWSYCTGAAVLSSPVVSAGVVYIASTNSTLAASTLAMDTCSGNFELAGSSTVPLSHKTARYTSVRSMVLSMLLTPHLVNCAGAVPPMIQERRSGHHPWSSTDWSSSVPPQR